MTVHDSHDTHGQDDVEVETKCCVSILLTKGTIGTTLCHVSSHQATLYHLSCMIQCLQCHKGSKCDVVWCMQAKADPPSPHSPPLLVDVGDSQKREACFNRELVVSNAQQRSLVCMQATEPASLIPLLCNCEAAVLVGDPCQLPPTVVSMRVSFPTHNAFFSPCSCLFFCCRLPVS